MIKKDTKQLLFENMEKLNPDFKQEENLQEVDPNVNPGATQPTTGSQQTQQFADKKYQMIAPQLKLVNSIEKFAPAFQGWFQYLGYSPHAGNISITRVREDVTNIMKQLGYR